MFVREKCVLFFEKSGVIFTKWCFIFVLFFDKSDCDHWVWSPSLYPGPSPPM